MFDPENLYWRVISNVRASGTQTVDAFVLESSYDRQSGDPMIEERRDDHYTTLFTRDLERKGMLLMVSPRDGEVRAIGEMCKKKQ